MCFSATASLVAGGALTAAGAATLPLARDKRELPLASVPLLFGIQQITDGVVWLSFGAPAVHTAAVYVYAFFAAVLWPAFVPFSVLLVERSRERKEALGALSLVGLGVGLYAAYIMLTSPVTAHVVNHCVAYDAPNPLGFVLLAFYLIASCGPFFVVRERALNAFGVALFVSFAIAWWFYVETFPSVWCFFAAVLSFLLYLRFKRRRARA